MPRSLTPPALAAAFGAAVIASAQTAAPVVEVEFLMPPAIPKGVVVQATAPAGTEWVVLFHRKVGETEFEALTLVQGKDGTFTANAEAAMSAGVPLQCYVAWRNSAGVTTLPAEAPAKFFSVTLPVPTAEPATPAPPPPVHGPIYVDGNATDLVHREVPVPNEPTLFASGQIRYAVRKDEDDRHLSFGTRIVYSNQPAPNQARWTVGDVQAAYVAGEHRLQAGDLMAQESEFTLGPGGRRGLDYTYSGRGLGAHLFALNTERQTGVTGLLWPVPGSEAYGGSLSLPWFAQALRTKVVFLTGRDDLANASNLVSAYAAPVREGSTGSLVVDGRFLENRLAVSGEYARSLFTKDAKDGAPKETDQAWRLAGQWAQGPYSAQASYRSVGQDFGTVGVAFFVGDRRVLSGGLGVNQPMWGISLSASDERTNPTGQPDLYQAWNQSQNLDARIALTPQATWRMGFRAGRQEGGIAANPWIPFSNSERLGAGMGFDLTLPPKLVLTFNAQYDHLRSTGFSTTTGTSKSLSMGGTLSLGTWARLSPNLSWSSILSQPGNQETTVSNAFLNAQFSLIPGRLMLLLNGGASRTALATGEALHATTAEGTLGLTLDPYLWKQVRGNFGVKARYTRNPVFMGIVEDNRVFLLLNLSF